MTLKGDMHRPAFDTRGYSLRDYLALERTLMSNQRTLLAFESTGLGFIVTGVTGIHVYPGTMGMLLSSLVLFLGVFIAVHGVFRFRLVKRRLDSAAPFESAEATAANISGADEAEAKTRESAA